MPIYDYKCKACDHRFELFTSIAGRDSAACPRCGGAVVRVYEGKWSMGARLGGGSAGGCGCGGSCSGCSGCGGR